MSRASKNGLTAGNSQPVKTLSKYATEFIATCARMASADPGFYLLCVVLLTQAVLLALGVLS
ncbi:MAG: hypothetical protein BWK72_18330 [Rhodoferax ferrireducens]|uniref:Uncharacterized protein n=1 Tax=Rhodoferax ferrireducens TaxID=192843 RepID=A0A1W9KPW0_9BURK|nr:MAG: hypothetical protein BWK72_18330 [Rhodoferax ferrireducens]